MNLRRILAVLTVFLAGTLFFSGMAEANGTLRATFKYRDASGAEQVLQNAYLYLQDGTVAPPMEKFFKSADYIFGPSTSLGQFTASVPAGTYYVRFTKRSVTGGLNPYLGPPQAGDYTWTDYQTITVTDNTVTDLGTKYATIYGDTITVTGVITSRSTGLPLPGRYVRAQPVPCIEADYSSENENEWIDSNACGPVKYLAQQKTDAQGRYTLLLKDPGSYYIITSRYLGDLHVEMAGNIRSTGYSTPITINTGDNLVLNMAVPPAY